MSRQHTLTTGSLAAITEQKNTHLKPVVQILGSKMMSGMNRIRACIWDGVTQCNYCLCISEVMQALFNAGKMNKFAIIRIEAYSLSILPQKANMPVILVTELTILKDGDEVGHKLDPGEAYEDAPTTTNNPLSSLSQLSTLSLSFEDFNNNVGPVLAARKMPSTMNPMNQYISPVSATTATFALMPSTSNQNENVSPILPAAVSPAPRRSTSHLKYENLCPVNVITPFFNAWVIRVRVISKTPIKTWNNKKGEGRLFSFDCCDEKAEVRITAFTAACDKFFDLIQLDKVYLISKGTVKSANQRYSSINNDYEITLDANSMVQLCPDEDAEGIPKLCFNFSRVADLNNMHAGQMVDIIGVIRWMGNIESFISKRSGKPCTKMNFTIADQSLAETRVTLWREVVADFKGKVGQIVAIKSATVGDFQGKTLTTSDSTVLLVEPVHLAEASELRHWYSIHGYTATFANLVRDQQSLANNKRLLCQINSKLVTENPGLNFSNFDGTIMSTNRIEKQMYKSCGLYGCMKKVEEEVKAEGTVYRCPKCNRSSSTFEWRMMISLNVLDVTGNVWLTVYQDYAEVLLNCKMPDLVRLYENDLIEFGKVINRVRFKSYSFRVGSKLDMYNDEKRVKSSAYRIQPHSPVERSRLVLASIDVLTK